MKIIITKKVKNKGKAINRKLLTKYWDILYPEKYVNRMVIDNRSLKPNE
jgi:hypothetical protein